MTAKGSERLSLEIKRLIKAPRDRVYAAWTDPTQLKQWFGPEKVQTRELVADARVGGKFRWDLTNRLSCAHLQPHAFPSNCRPWCALPRSRYFCRKVCRVL